MPDVASIREYLRSLKQRAQVLIVDDEPGICEALAMACGDFGLNCVTVQNAEAACDLLDAQEFSLLVSDKNLPLMSGLDLFQHAMKVAPDLPMVMITGYASVDSVKQALSIGAIDYIAKPFPDVYAVTKKLAAIVEHRIHLAVYERISTSLIEDIRVQGDKGDLANLIAQKLGRFKTQLAHAPAVIIFDDEQASAPIVDACEAVGIKTLATSKIAEVTRHLEESTLASVALVALDKPESMRLLETIGTDTTLSIVLSSTTPDLRSTLAALALGANELYLRDIEPPEILAARLKHTIASVKRERTYARLFDALFSNSELVDARLVHLISGLAPAARRRRASVSTQTGGKTADAASLLRELSTRS